MILGVLAGGVVVASTAQVIRDSLYARIASHLLNDLHLRMFTHLQALSLGFYARVQSGDIGTHKTIAVMQDGDCFGEIALLQHMPRTATVRALIDCVLLYLGRGQLMRLLQHDPQLREQIAQLAMVRVHR